jgi:uncharacterized protein YxeA
MKKKLLIIVTIIFSILVIGILTYKKEVKYDKFTTVQIENNPFDFGTITENDTIKHSFKITNTSKTLFVIEQVVPSCTCTVSKTDKKVCNINETANILVSFKPKPQQKGKVKTVVFVQCNAEKGVIKLELTGNIK